MKRLGVTQRVDLHPATGERRDALDQNWSPFLAQAGFVAIPLPNLAADPAQLVSTLGLDGVVLSGGNDIASLPGARNSAPERDVFEAAMVVACADQSLPVLGVCRGAQMLNHLAGGRISRLAGHVTPSHCIFPVASAFSEEAFSVAGYHDFGIAGSDLAADFEAMALAEDGSVEAFRAQDALRGGIMWHPERETPFHQRDLALVTRFFERQPW